MPELKISVAMATFNGARYLQEQLDSFSRQVRLPLELVVTDDGSTDQTLEILRAFSRRAPFDVHIHQNPQRLGFADNFMQAVSMCRGDLIAFSDQDDVWLPEKLARSAEPFADPTVAMTLHCGRVVDADLVPLGWSLPAIDVSVVLPPLHDRPTFLAPGFAQMFRANLPLLRQGGGPRTDPGTGRPLAHDQWTYCLAWVFGKTAYINDELVMYRRHGSTVSRPVPLSTVGYLQNAMRASASDYENVAKFYRAWGDYFALNLLQLHEVPRRLAEDAAQHFRCLEEMLSARSLLYRSDIAVLTKCSRLIRAIQKGHYQSHGGGFGGRGVVKDLVGGIGGLSRYA